MIRGTLTLLNRSVRGDALSPHAHHVRLASVGILFLFLLIAHARSSFAPAPGLDFFKSLAWLGFALITLAGIGHFSNSITEEKEEGTIGLLLLANISPLAILLGKSTNRVLSTLLIFAAQFPFALLSITLGGISIAQIVGTFITLGGYLFLVANIALLASVVSKRSSEAAALVVLLIFLVVGFIPSVDHSINELIKRGYVTSEGWLASTLDVCMNYHTATSVLTQIQLIFDPTQDFALFSKQLLFSIFVGGCFFLISWIYFGRLVWAPESVEPQRVDVSLKYHRWLPVVSRPWKWSIAWKDFHFVSGGPLYAISKCLVFPIPIYLCFVYHDKIRSVTGVFGGQFARDSLLIILTMEVLLISSQLFHTERKMGTLPTLLMLPRTVAYVGYSKLLGSLFSLLPTIIALIATEYCLKCVGTGELLLYSKSMAIGLGGLLVLGHLTALCSLIVKWGALPLAIGITLIVGMLLVPFVAAAMQLIQISRQGLLAEMSPVIYATGVSCAAIQFEIGRRLQLIAGN